MENENKNPNDTLDNLADRLEQELGARRYFQQIDMRGNEIKREKSPEVIELEKEINDMPNEFSLNQKNKKTQKSTRLRPEQSHDFGEAQKEKIPQSCSMVVEKAGLGKLVKIIRRPVVYLVGIEMLIYFFSSLDLLKNFMLDVFLPFILILDIIVFIYIFVRVVKEERRTKGVALKALILAGVLVGLFRGIFKIIWVNEMWTILNVVFEPIIGALTALIIGAILSIFKYNKHVIRNM